MSLTYTGSMSGPIGGLRDLLAASATFQDWVDEDDAEGAADHIYIGEAEEGATRPNIVIFPMEKWRMAEIAARGGGLDFLPSGDIGALIEGEVPTEYAASNAEAFIWWCNTVEAIIEDMKALTATDTYFVCNSIESMFGPARANTAERKQEADYMQQLLKVSWGFPNG